MCHVGFALLSNGSDIKNYPVKSCRY